MPTMKFAKDGSGGGSSMTRQSQLTDAVGVGVSMDLPGAKRGVLTTRTNNTDGVITMDPGHGLLITDKISLFWPTGLIWNGIVNAITGDLATVGLQSLAMPTSLGAQGRDTIIGGEKDDDVKRFGEDEEEEDKPRKSVPKDPKKFSPSPKKSAKEGEPLTPMALVTVNSVLPIVGTVIYVAKRVIYNSGTNFVGNNLKGLFCGASVPWAVGFIYAVGGGVNDGVFFGNYESDGGIKTVDLVNNIANDGSGVVDVNPFAGETMSMFDLANGSPSPATVSVAALISNP